MNIPNIIAAIMLAVAAALAVSAHQFIRNRVIVTGRVTQLVYQPSKRSGTYKIVAEFRDAAGLPHTYRSSFSSSNPGYAVGAPIGICYREDAPEDCGVYSFGYRFGVAWIIACLALTLVTISLGFRHGKQVMDAVYLGPTNTVELR